MKRARWLVAAAAFAMLLAACAGPADPDEQLQVPTRARFELVSGVLGTRCGSLDCHGQVGRSLRIYSQLGLRLDQDAYPSPMSEAISDEEVLANYQSAVTLEPEQLALVVRDHGANAERLTLVRKARGTEQHKGGSPIAIGDPADVCLLSWLAGGVDSAACTAGALQPPRPDAGFP
jgi:hypothetical protein